MEGAYLNESFTLNQATYFSSALQLPGHGWIVQINWKPEEVQIWTRIDSGTQIGKEEVCNLYASKGESLNRKFFSGLVGQPVLVHYDGNAVTNLEFHVLN